MREYDWHYEKSTPHVLEQVARRLERAQRQNQLQPSYETEYLFSPDDSGGGYFDRNEGQVPNNAGDNVAINARDKAKQQFRYFFYHELPSTPFMQFKSQAARERRRLEQQRGLQNEGRRQTLPWDETVGPQGSAENNIRRSWVNQGIWAKEWGPAWPEYADVLFSLNYQNRSRFRRKRRVRHDLKKVRRRFRRGLKRIRGRVPVRKRGRGHGNRGLQRAVPGHPFKDLRWEVDLFKPFPNSWGHEKAENTAGDVLITYKSARMSSMDLGPPEKLIPKVRCPAASTPAAQFESQVVKERDWIRDEVDFQNNWDQVDLDARARASVRQNWILDGIWRAEWDQEAGGKPFGRWLHEIPSGEETPPPQPPPVPTDLSEIEEIQIGSAFLHGDGRINRWLTKAQAKSIASFCFVGWREIRAACHPRPDVISDDESSDEEDAMQLDAVTGAHEEASAAGIEDQQGSSAPAGQVGMASSGSTRPTSSAGIQNAGVGERAADMQPAVNAAGSEQAQAGSPPGDELAADVQLATNAVADATGSGLSQTGSIPGDELPGDLQLATDAAGSGLAQAGGMLGDEHPDDVQPAAAGPSAPAHLTESGSSGSASRPGPSRANASASSASARRRGVRDAEPQAALRRNPPRAARFQAPTPAPAAAAAPSRTRAPRKPTKAKAKAKAKPRSRVNTRKET